MKVIYAPDKNYNESKFSVFLAGSIAMGKAENWQDKVIEGLCDLKINILNPRRRDWDSSWEQSINNPQFKEQVEWELDAQEKAHCILMYFDPSTESPISLLELGLFAKTGKMIVICPTGFWKKGNVDVVCEKYNVMMVGSIEDGIDLIKSIYTPL